jgi:hypothetical protein
MHLLSFSITTTLWAPSERRPLVKPPGPGPISKISNSVKSPADLAIFEVRFKSKIKFWPKDFFAFRSYFSITCLIG